ncbi:hypothetical protein D3C71_2034980 [compost metagenome]
MIQRFKTKRAINKLRINLPESYAVFDMGMNNVVFQKVNALNRIVAGYHHQIRRIEVDTNSP